MRAIIITVNFQPLQRFKNASEVPGITRVIKNHLEKIFLKILNFDKNVSQFGPAIANN